MSNALYKLLPAMARVLILLMLAGQAALAAQPCMMPDTHGAMPCEHEAQNKDEAFHTEPDCAGMQASICHTHLTQDHRNLLLSFPPDTPAINLLPVPYLLTTQAFRLLNNDYQRRQLAQSGDPPLSILFCTFQT